MACHLGPLFLHSFPCRKTVAPLYTFVDERDLWNAIIHDSYDVSLYKPYLPPSKSLRREPPFFLNHSSIQLHTILPFHKLHVFQAFFLTCPLQALDNMDLIDREAFLDDLLSLNQQQQQLPPSTATNSNHPQGIHASSPSSSSAATASSSHASTLASPANAAPHVWDVEALAKMMKSSPPEADDVQDFLLATRQRSTVPSLPAIPNPPGSSDSIYFNYFGTYTPTTATTESASSLASYSSCSVPQAPVTEFFIPIPSTLQHRQELMAPFELTPDHHLDLSCGPITTMNPNPDPMSLSNAIVVASSSQPMFDSKDPTPIYQGFSLHQQPFDYEFDPMPIETSPIYDASPIVSPESKCQSVFSSNMTDLHQQTSPLLSTGFSTPAAAAPSVTFPSTAIPATSFPLLSLATPCALVDFGMAYGLDQQTSALLNNGNSVTASAASSPSAANHHYNHYSMAVAPGAFNPNSPEHLSDLSNLVQRRQRLLQRQQKQHLQQQLQMTSSRPPLPTPHPPLPCNQLDNSTINHTSTSYIDNMTNNSTRQYSFVRPLNANSFAQSIFYTSPHIEHSTSTNDASYTSLSSSTDATHHHHQLTTLDFLSVTGVTKRRLGRPPLDRMPPTSPTTPTTTFSTSSSSSSSTSSSTSSRTPSPGVCSSSSSSSSSSRQVSPKRFYIVEPYQHTDQKVDRRSFNSRKQLRQLQAQEAQANERDNEDHEDHQDFHPRHRQTSS